MGGYDKSCGLALSFALIFHVSVVSVSVSGGLPNPVCEVLAANGEKTGNRN